MPPPPPPPPAPPPPLPNVAGSMSGSVPDRSALLSQIRKGKPLKKAQTNDRSAPVVSGSKSSSSLTVGGTNSSSAATNNGPTPPFIPPGGLFAHGIPKLRPTGSRPGDHQGASPNNRSSEGEISSESIFNANAVGMSRSQPPSPLMKARQQQQHGANVVNRNFPSDLNIKGPAPVPPPASHKPRFSNQDHDANKNNAANIRRSLSQTGLGYKIRPARPPPNIRPPPPPKGAPTAAAMTRAPPPPPLKPPNVKRRQSFGVADAATMSVYNGGARFPGAKTVVPQPPPRNNSVPNSLNQVPNSSPTAVHVNKMTTAPPPPPPTRPLSACARPPVTRPPPPPVARSAAPPPPPPHRSPTYPAPPSQLKATASFGSIDAPTPPQRISSVMGSQPSDTVSDFEARFLHKFQGSDYFPLPDRFANIQKTYPSRAMSDRSSAARRQPPPPPPPGHQHGNLARSHSVSQTRLHIQLDARVFANNTAHC